MKKKKGARKTLKSTAAHFNNVFKQLHFVKGCRGTYMRREFFKSRFFVKHTK